MPNNNQSPERLAQMRVLAAVVQKEKHRKTKYTYAKVKREIKRRLERIALGLPVKDSYSDTHLVPVEPNWKKVVRTNGKRLFIIPCKRARGKQHVIELLLSSRKIWWKIVNPQKGKLAPKVVQHREVVKRGRKKKEGIIERNLQKGDMTISKFVELLQEHEYEPPNMDSRANNGRVRTPKPQIGANNVSHA
jgi:hypothetical protein